MGKTVEQKEQHLQQEKKGKAPEQHEMEQIVGIKELVDAGLREVPPLYVRPPHERPASAAALPASNAAAAHNPPQHCIPLLDLTPLAYEDGHPARKQLLREIGRACEEWGFFQIVNHGVEASVIQRLREAAARFFDQPAEERMRFHGGGSLNRRASVSYSTSFNPAMEKVREWRDGLILQLFPPGCDGFRDAPAICKKEVQEYMQQVDDLARKLYKMIFESLGLENEYVEIQVPNIPCAIMSINYYPRCPDPTLTLGLSSHSDGSCITILLPDANVNGLEIKHDDTWVPIVPMDPSALVINLGDQIEILTNGKYKSIEHKVVTNANKPRMSVACFFMPVEDAIVAPLPLLLDGNNPPQYKPTMFKDYLENFYASELQSKRGLDIVRI